MLPVLHSAAFWNFMMYFCMFLGGAVLAGAFLFFIILTAVMAVRSIVRAISPPVEITEKYREGQFYPHGPIPLKLDANGFARIDLTPPKTPPQSPEAPDALEKALAAEAQKDSPANSP